MGAPRRAEYVPLEAAKPSALRPWKQPPGPFLDDLDDLTPATEVPARVAKIREDLAGAHKERVETT